jgi:hypothetical protein
LDQLEAGLGRRQVGLVGRKRMDYNIERRKKGSKGERKERLNLACFKT